jgi:hypothetical protein
MPERRSLSLVQLITLSLSKLSLLQRMACNDNDKRKLEEEAESLTARKRLRLFDDDASDDDSYEGGAGDRGGGLLGGNIDEQTPHLQGEVVCQAWLRHDLQ